MTIDILESLKLFFINLRELLLKGLENVWIFIENIPDSEYRPFIVIFLGLVLPYIYAITVDDVYDEFNND